MGYNNLKGIELQHTAVEKAMRICKDISVVQGSAFDLPFDNGQFDMVFTSGVLIHIAPSELDKIMDEMFRVTNKYIWGFEYFSDEHTEVNYRGNMDKLWKGNFMKLFLNRFPELSVVKDLRFKYLNGENIDQMYVLEKTG
jgi:pseudaminic acid biosynthesis-associated methylase